MGPLLYDAGGVVVGGGSGDLRCQDKVSSRPSRRSWTATGPAAADDAVGTTAKDLAREDVCMDEAETGRWARELGLAAVLVLAFRV